MLILIIIAIIVLKYKPLYAVTISGKLVGYVNNKVEFEEKVNNEVLAHNGNVAFVTVNQFPEYKLELISRKQQTNEEELIKTLKESAETTYKYYAVSFNNETKAYVNTMEEAEQLVAEIKNEHSGNVELNIGISEYYTVNVDDAQKIDQNTNVVLAKQQIEDSVNSYIEKEQKTVNGIYLATTPVNGVITSRFNSIESVRIGAHTGLDIGAPTGTPILAITDGVVKYSAPMGTYGNLVIISHGNGIETYYAHCSKLLVSVGQNVSSGEQIALVGSTGNSTGSHLHVEVRVNGKPVNPQNYLYNK